MGRAGKAVLWLVVLLLFPALVFAQQQRLKTILDYKKELNLNKDQEEKIKAYLFDLERELRELKGKLASVNSEIRQLLQQGAKKQGSLKLKEVEAKIKESYQIRADMAIAEIRTAEKINRVLTPKQFEKWKKIIKERRGKGGKG